MSTHTFSVNGDGNSTQFVIESPDSVITSADAGAGDLSVSSLGDSLFVDTDKLLCMHGCTVGIKPNCMQRLLQNSAKMLAKVPCFLLLESNQDGVLRGNFSGLPHCVGKVPVGPYGEQMQPAEYIACICEAIWENADKQAYWVNKFYSNYPISTDPSQPLGNGLYFYSVLLGFLPALMASGEPVNSITDGSGNRTNNNDAGFNRLRFDQLYVDDPSNSGCFMPNPQIIEDLKQPMPGVEMLTGDPTTTYWGLCEMSSFGYKGLKWECRNAGVDWDLYPEGSGVEGDQLRDQPWYQEFVVEMIAVFGLSISDFAKQHSNGQRSRVMGGLHKDWQTNPAHYPKIGDTCTCYQAFVPTEGDADTYMNLITERLAEKTWNDGNYILCKGPAQPTGDTFVANLDLNSSMAGPARKLPALDPSNFETEGMRHSSQVSIRLCFWYKDAGKVVDFPWPYYSEFTHGSRGKPMVCKVQDPCLRDGDGKILMQAGAPNMPQYRLLGDMTFPETSRML